MPAIIKHLKNSTIPDGTDASLVLPSDWNADHQLSGTMDILQGGTGATTALGARNNILPTQTGNAGKVLGTDGTNTSWVAGGGTTLTGKTDSATPFTTALGTGAGAGLTVGTNNALVGYNAGLLLTGGSQNAFFGALAGDAMTTGGVNVAVGYNALGSTTASNNNTVVGNSALSGANNTAGNNTIIGASAANVLTGGYNVMIGGSVGTSALTLANSVVIGWNNLEGATLAANGIVAIGYLAGNGITTSAGTTLIGNNAGAGLTTAANSTMVGWEAGKLVTGAGNTLVGKSAGSVLTTGSNNTLIGTYGGDAVGMSNNFIASDGAGNRKIQVSDTGALAINGGGYGVAGAYLQSNGVGAAPTWVYPNILGFQNLTATTLITPSEKDVYFANATTAGFTITLPAAASNPGLCFYIKRTDTSVNTLDIASSGGLIEGSPSATQGPGVSVQYISDGTNWWELANG